MATYIGTEGNDSISGGGEPDNIDGNGGNDFLAGNGDSDFINGGAGNDTLYGDSGNDQLDGGAGNDLVSGGSGQDDYLFREFGAANADTVGAFDTSWDRILLDQAGFTNLGATGRFAAGDVRFFAAPGATAGHDADDRIVYNTSTGQLFYDADGNGAGASQLIATFQGAPNITATDINSFGSPTPSPTPTPTPPGSVINGTSGNDTLIGTDGPDTINGFGGDDSLVGNNGADLLVGGDGNDTLDGQDSRVSPATDTLDGGLGNDLFRIGYPGDAVTDAGGIDTIDAIDLSYNLGPGFENLIVHNDVSEGGQTAFGNELDNRIDVTYGTATVNGQGGNDTLTGGWLRVQFSGGDGNDSLVGGDGRVDWLDGGTGNDTLTGSGSETAQAGAEFVFSAAPGAANADVITDFHTTGWGDMIRLDGRVMPQVGASGTFVPDDARFYAAPGATGGHDADDRIVYNTTTGQLFYDADGSGGGAAQLLATLQGAPLLRAEQVAVDNGTTATPSPTPSPTPTPSPIPAGSMVGTAGNDNMQGTSGNDSIFGLGGNDTIFANGGNDWVQGGAGNDSVSGGGGQDIYAFAEYGAANADTVANFDTNWDAIRLDAAGFSNIGATGRFAGGDVRFFSGAGATSAHDADDRIVYNTSTGQLFYDADGAGGTGAELIATFNGAPGIAATDITVFGTATPSPTPSPTPTPTPGAINGTEGNDSLVGTDGNDTINGFGGNDTIDGRGGVDSMVGGTGDDLYFVDNPSDMISEGQNEGIDEVRATSSYTLPAFVNNLTLSGGATSGSGNAIENVITGNGLDNMLSGNEGNDTLIGLDGNDTLDGGIGVDSMVGGNGDDVYFVGDAGDTVVEAQNGGIDEVRSLIDYTLPDWVNNLTLLNSAVSGTGNGIENLITGNSANNVISGGDGNDTLIGNEGADTLLGGNGNDAIYGRSPTLGAADGDLIDGGAGNDTLNGGGGIYRFSDAPGAANADWITSIMTGGANGGDTFQLDGRVHLNAGPSGRFTADDGRFYAAAGATGGHDADDRVVYDVTSGNVYWDADGSGAGAAQLIVKVVNGGVNLSATEFEIINGTSPTPTPTPGSSISGTGGNDTLIGTAGNDTIFGNSGNDWIEGRGGNDQLSGGSGQDSYVFREFGAANADTLNNFDTNWDAMRFDSSAFTALGDPGHFTAGDARFFAGAGATAAHDADDRIVYNTSSGQLYYDADGAGGADAQLVATIQAAAPVAAPDIWVI